MECRANLREGFDPNEVLQLPPCDCPECLARELDLAPDVGGPTWLRVSGRQQRLRVEPAELGPLGHDALG